MKQVDLHKEGATVPATNLIDLRQALEASWDAETSFEAVRQDGNPSFGQCYPTSRVLQFFFPEFEIVKGTVWTGSAHEIHFWNVLIENGHRYDIDLTWQQFPYASKVDHFELLDRDSLNDSETTVKRCELLKERVLSYLDRRE